GPEAPVEPSWDHAKALSGWLNGRDRTDVFLGEEGGSRYLVVAGGNAGRHIVVVQEPGRYFHLARRPDPGEAEELVEVVVGGLPDFYPPALVHPLPSPWKPPSTTSGPATAPAASSGCRAARPTVEVAQAAPRPAPS